MKDSKITIAIISALCVILALVIAATVLIIANDPNKPDIDTSTETEQNQNQSVHILPPIELADERHLIFLKTSDDSAYTVAGLNGEISAITIMIPEKFEGLPVIGIEAGAFDLNADLVTLVMSDSIEYIGQSAFEGCTSLKNISLSKNLKYVGDLAFNGCSSIKFNEYDNALYLGCEDAPYTVLYEAKSKDIESCIINSATKIICNSAFAECSELNSVTIPDGIMQIGSDAFTDCYDLFPNPDESDPHYQYTKDAYYLGNRENPFLVFCGARGRTTISSIKIHEGTKIIAPGAFSGCKNLEHVTLPSGVTFVGEFAFEGCENIELLSVSGNAKWRIFNSEAVYLNDSFQISESSIKQYCEFAWIKNN